MQNALPLVFSLPFLASSGWEYRVLVVPFVREYLVLPIVAVGQLFKWRLVCISPILLNLLLPYGLLVLGILLLYLCPPMLAVQRERAQWVTGPQSLLLHPLEGTVIVIAPFQCLHFLALPRGR